MGHGRNSRLDPTRRNVGCVLSQVIPPPLNPPARGEEVKVQLHAVLCVTLPTRHLNTRLGPPQPRAALCLGGGTGTSINIYDRYHSEQRQGTKCPPGPRGGTNHTKT